MPAPSFSMGRIVATPTALAALAEAGASPSELLDRHARLDPGCLDRGDVAANHEALVTGARILSAYALPSGEKVWVITEAVGDGGQRASTCILLPDDY